MGSPLSPALCDLVVAYREQCWFDAFQTIRQSAAILTTRYVDNRAIIVPQSMQALPGLREFIDLNFYGQPIVLEPCGNNIFLGCDIDVKKLQVRFVLPTRPVQFRTVR